MIGLVGYLSYIGHLDALVNSMSLGLENTLAVSATITAKVIGWAVLMLAILAGADVPLQIWLFNNRLKMSRQEIKEESKETEGNPEVKGRIRQAQREMARRRMIDDVKKADVVITNPTHYSVALAYSEGANGAPKIVAKGVDEIAAHIREAAKEAGVLIVESPKLARAIYATTDMGKEIPEALYLAVAYVLNYAFAVKAFEKGGAPKQPTLASFSVPDELDPESAMNQSKEKTD
jgi:flagellar biosynthetic protein FlhB